MDKNKVSNALNNSGNASKEEFSEGVFSVEDVKKLAEEIRSLNKTLDLRNPLISESESNIVDEILKDSKTYKLQERQLDVDSINKDKDIYHKLEGEKEKWNRFLNYDIPTDDNR
jgi:hypothetical protein